MKLCCWMFVLWLLVGCSNLDEVSTDPTVGLPGPTTSPQAALSAPPARTAFPTPTTSPTGTATPAAIPSATPTAMAIIEPSWIYPIGLPDRPPGDGFFIRHGYTVENTWYNPGYWHTGEDWYALEGDTAGASVYAVSEGEVVYAGSNYPGRVVIVRHADDLFSMYGHLDPVLAVEVGQQVVRRQVLGTVLRRTDSVPNHLHFEIRTFLTTPEVNGDRPRYGFRCGPNCAPGPGYWPIDAPDLPSGLGWRNPTHGINRRAFPAGPAGTLSAVIVATQPISPSVTLWEQLGEDGTPQQPQGNVSLQPGERFTLLEVRTGPEDSQAASALAYVLWYRVRLPDGRAAWIAAAVPSAFETGSDGRPSTTRFNLLPVADIQGLLEERGNQ